MGIPKISVIMLTYNRERLIDRMIECILAQTFRDFEFIIVDNGSTDHSGAIADQYAVQDSRIRVIHRERGNIGSGRNAGLDTANGDYIAFIDDDDTCEPDFLEFLYKLAMENNAAVSICGAADKVFDEKRVMTAEEALTELFWRKKYNVQFPTKLVKSLLFMGIRFSETSKYDDIELMPKILGEANKVAYHGLPKYTFYRHGTNNSAWTTNHSLLTSETLDEYLRVYRERTEWLSEIFPASMTAWRYFELSFMISMVEKITRLGIKGCELQLGYMKKELQVHNKEFIGSGHIHEFEKSWIGEYIMKEITAREQLVFDSLADERSKKVFAARRNAVMRYPVDFAAYDSVFDFIQEFAEINEYHRQISLESILSNFATSDSKFILYGASKNGASIAEKIFAFNNERFNDCIGVWDMNPLLNGSDLYGIPIISPPRKIDVAQYSDIEVFVTPSVPVTLNEIIAFLLTLGFRQEQIITLGEFSSRECNYAEFEPFRQVYGDEEIFVDGGCLNFGSSLELLKACPNLKKIYAFEPGKNARTTIERNIHLSGFENVHLIEAALWSENKSLSFQNNSNSFALSSVEKEGDTLVEGVAFDSVVESDENITFIKMDIEGAELEALKGMRKTIRRCKPKLAISIYHKSYDYVDIPEYILSLVPEYKVFMRHYSDNIGESVMFALI
ncbi:hypothetical protein SDC9_44029 [bioreactor metagenome]|uniref:Undecaprenyl-phosphate 4-deoxy-4-formamido-L-arabinose transferase n=1 Tax=bioreactor metagenome TaxID=1076179 RepID=A0A644W283_9ZZZZ